MQYIYFLISGNFSCLYATFEFDRDTRYYLVQSYLPAALIVILSWLGFWIDERAVPARVSLGITTILSITTLFFGIQTLLPKVGYLKAVDVYLFGSLLFVFGALVEYALICWHSKGLEGKVSEIERQKAETRVRKRNWWDLQEHPKKSKTEEGLVRSFCSCTKHWGAAKGEGEGGVLRVKPNPIFNRKL